MGRRKSIKPGQFGHVSETPKIDLPSSMLIDPVHVISELYGGECGLGQYVESGGTYVCENQLSVEVLDRKGAAYQIMVKCPNPNHSRTFWTSGRDSNGTFHVNKYIAVAGRIAGMKYQKTREFVAALGSPMQNKTSYYNVVKDIATACSTSASDSKSRSAATLRREMGVENWNGETLNIVVAADGTWLTRGQKSRHGVATVLAAVTHQVLDTEVESSYCTVCSAQHGIPDPSLVHDCQITHKGSAGAMEISGVKKIFIRAPSVSKFRATTIVRDGDSKVHEMVKNVYGPEYPVVSLADKNHAMKAFLRRLMEGRKGARTVDGQKIIGANRVTKDFAETLASYFRLAVQQSAKASGTVEEVSNAVWRIFHHKTGDHSRCENVKWCSYEKAKRDGTLDSYKQTGTIDRKYLEPLKYVFDDVTKPEYLTRLLHDYSTSWNESFHSLIWSFCSKHQFASTTSVKIATDMATCIWNDGYAMTMEALYDAMKLDFPPALLVLAKERDKNRKEQKDMAALLKTPLSITENELENYAELFGFPSALPENTKSVAKVKRTKKAVGVSKKKHKSAGKKDGPKVSTASTKVGGKRGRPKIAAVRKEYESGAWD